MKRPKRPNFDQYNRQPMKVMLFVHPDGSVGLLEGRCRGFGGISGNEKPYKETIGIYLPDGSYHNIQIDLRVKCAVPTFMIDCKWFFYPIVRCSTIGMKVDGETGIAMPATPEEENRVKRVRGD